LTTKSRSQAGAIIHELSHVVWHTTDHAEGIADVLALAVRDPAEAIDNPDSYEFFAEEG
jgi:hypothetical protein